MLRPKVTSFEPRDKPLEAALVASIVLIALALMILQAQAVFINVGGFSLSVYALVLAAALLGAATLQIVVSVLFTKQPTPDRNRALFAFAISSPLLTLSAIATLRLALDWRLEGAQNLLALYVLTLGPLVFWLSRSWPSPLELLRLFSWTIGCTAVVYVFFRISDLPGFADRQFAMVGLVGLAAAASLTPRILVERLIPYVVFVGIIVSGSRTASAIALIFLALIASRAATTAPKKALRVSVSLVTGFVIATASYLTLGIVDERIEERGFSGTVTEVITNSNGRFGAWAEFLNLLTTPADWIFGRGTGAAMEFGTANLAFFSHPHNEYIRYLVDLGLLGVLLLAAGCISLLFVLFANQGFAQDASRAAILVMVALAGLSLTDGPLYSSFVIVPAALVVGGGLRSRWPGKIVSQDNQTSAINASESTTH